MKAIYFTSHGDSSTLTYGEIPRPVPREDEALIRVHYAALNHLDIWVRRGWKGLNLQFPHVTGSDILGEIVSLPPGPHGFSIADIVLVNPGVTTTEDEWTQGGQDSLSPGYRVIGEHLPGGLAEYVCAPIKNLLVVPGSAPHELLAALPVVAQTCWRMLKTIANIQRDQTVLIVGSGGGVNSLATQLCSSFGCPPIVLAGSNEKASHAKKLGATSVINYRSTPDWHRDVLAVTNGRGVDFVIDNVGAATFEKSLKSLCMGGTLLTVGNTSGPIVKLDNRLIFAKQLRLIGSTMGSHQDFKDSVSYLVQEQVYPVIDTVVPLAEGISQLQRLERGEQFGKIVLACAPAKN